MDNIFSDLSIFIVASFLLAFTPGPAVVYIVAQTTAIGRKAGLLSAIGVGIGDFCQVLIVAMGLGKILQESVVAIQALKFFGFSYLCFLAWKSLPEKAFSKSFKRQKLVEKVEQQLKVEHLKQKSPGKLFWQGFWVQLLNPKTALFFIAFLPQFTNPDKGSWALQIIFLGGVFVLSCFLSDLLYIIFATEIKKYLSKKSKSNFVKAYFRFFIYLGLGFLILSDK